METYDYLKQYYDNYDEDSRLTSKHGQIEFLTTLRYIEKYLSPKMKVLEIGAGTGKYSHTLARKGYEVKAVELIQHNIDIFNEKTTPKENISVIQGNAIDLSVFDNNTFDITLLLGPMYHLYSEENQKKALSEAIRVTKNNGMIFAAYCMSDASIICYGFRDGNISELINKGLLDTETFKTYSTPAELFQLYRKEDIDSLMLGFSTSRLHFVGTDLYTNYMRETIDAMDDTEFSMYLKYHFNSCERPDLVGITHHSLDILKKLK